ncbi:hypothetical protein [Flavobacterium sp. H122]|uniref:hypothetical protein n=1 Tax=Flavobacterium sp. H122 TaxID=2529860 RepID=UPI0010AA7673|nr:hypothetical protein [Flavobacterium sp. H122]
MVNRFRLMERKFNLLLFVFAIFFVGCERNEKKNAGEGIAGKKLEISSGEIQRILNTKANLESSQVSENVRLSLPENYFFRTSTLSKEDVSYSPSISLIVKDSCDYVELKNPLFAINNNQIADEIIFIVKAEKSDLLSVKKMKSDYNVETVYFEDKNSIVFSDDDTFSTLHFQYDSKTKNYLIYTGTISWSKKFTQEEKLNQAFYFLRNAKNLLSPNFTKQEFSWNDYVANRPKIEVNLMKYFFKNFKKEMSGFLNVHEVSSPEYDSHSFFELYRMPKNGEHLFYSFLNQIQEGKFEEAYELKWARELFYTDDKCKVVPKGNATMIEITELDYDGKIYGTKYMVCSTINKGGQSFLLKTDDDLNEGVTDFFLKMFDYYSNHSTLELTN